MPWWRHEVFLCGVLFPCGSGSGFPAPGPWGTPRLAAPLPAFGTSCGFGVRPTWSSDPALTQTGSDGSCKACQPQFLHVNWKWLPHELFEEVDPRTESACHLNGRVKACPCHLPLTNTSPPPVLLTSHSLPVHYLMIQLAEFLHK